MVPFIRQFNPQLLNREKKVDELSPQPPLRDSNNTVEYFDDELPEGEFELSSGMPEINWLGEEYPYPYITQQGHQDSMLGFMKHINMT